MHVFLQKKKLSMCVHCVCSLFSQEVTEKDNVMFCRSPVVCASDVSTFIFISVYTLLLSFLLPLSIIPNKFISCLTSSWENIYTSILYSPNLDLL